MEKEDRYREARRWYAADRNVTTLTEIIAMFERVQSGTSADAGTAEYSLPTAAPVQVARQA
jgi:hypothetical protein